MTMSNDFGATEGQSQQFMQIFHLLCGTAVAKSYSTLGRLTSRRAPSQLRLTPQWPQCYD